MIARLQTKRDQRAYTEYEASVTAARQAEEKNQAAQNYSRQLQEGEQQQRDRSFQLAQITAKIAEVDNQLSSLSVVTSAYSGVVRRIKIQGQTNNNLSVELTLAVGGSPTAVPSPSPGNSFTPSPTPTIGN
jgi:multidrug resistance efflux pump